LLAVGDGDGGGGRSVGADRDEDWGAAATTAAKNMAARAVSRSIYGWQVDVGANR